MHRVSWDHPVRTEFLLFSVFFYLPAICAADLVCWTVLSGKVPRFNEEISPDLVTTTPVKRYSISGQIVTRQVFFFEINLTFWKLQVRQIDQRELLDAIFAD